MSEASPPTGEPAPQTPPAVTPPPAASAPPPASTPPPAHTPSIPQPSLPVPIQPGERVLLLRRRHWMYLWPNVALNAAFGIIPAIAFIWLTDAVGLEGGIVTLLIVVYLAIFAIRLALVWYRYQHDYWVITNQRVIDVKRNHPLNLQVSTADLVNIQDMTIQRNGLFRTMLDYGDVVCQTAGTMDDFMIAGVKDPRAVQALVDRERDRERMRIRAG